MYTVPDSLWDFAVLYVCKTVNVIESTSIYARYRTPLEQVTIIMLGITEYLDFGFYDIILFNKNSGVSSHWNGAMPWDITPSWETDDVLGSEL